ncbi:MAG: S-layer homology domain-containing protein [Clostridia bacterium]|nr:S-layer homology domain-containing protein [Clostridia bacterium]
MKKRRLSALLAGLAAGLMLAMPVHAASTLSDMSGHWAEEYVYSGVEAGYISGYTDGTFQPERTVTRAEFSKMLNQAIGMKTAADIRFTDVTPADWYYEEVRKAVAAGYISGYTDNTFRANVAITRQEAAVIVARVVAAPASTRPLTELSDYADIAGWASSYVRIINTKGYMMRSGETAFRPNDPLTRGEAAMTIAKLLAGEKIVRTDQIVGLTGVQYKDTLFANNVTVAESLGKGNVRFENSRVMGRVTVYGGGPTDGMLLTDTAVPILTLSDTDGDIHVVAAGTTQPGSVTLTRGAHLEERAVTGEGFTDLTLSGDKLEEETVRLRGDFDTVTIKSPTTIQNDRGSIQELVIESPGVYYLSAGEIELLKVDGKAEDVLLYLEEDVTIEKAELSAPTAFLGEGVIEESEELAAGALYDGVEPEEIDAFDGDAYEPKEDYKHLTPVFSPEDGEKGVSPSASIELTFLQKLYRTSGRELTESYLEEDVFELWRGDPEDERAVAFDLELASDDHVIRVTPKEELREDTEYTLILLPDSVANGRGDTNPKAELTFTTGGTTWLVPEIEPADEKTNVARGTDIRLEFDHDVYRASGADLSESYLENTVIELRKGSRDGSLVNFTAELSDGDRVITLYPEGNLSTNTTYFVRLIEETLSDDDGHLNTEFWSAFSTGSTIARSIFFDPDDSESNVPLDTAVTITFPYAVLRHDNGEEVRASYLEDEAFELRRGSSTGSRVDFTAEISSDDRTVTLTPYDKLSTNSTYYVILLDETLEYKDGDAIERTSSYFRTGDGTGRITAFKLSQAYTTSADVKVTSSVDGTVHFNIKPASGEAFEQSTQVYAGESKTVTLTDLEAATTYTVTAAVTGRDGNTSTASSLRLTTAQPEISFKADQIDKTGARLIVTFDAPGAITVTYWKKSDSKNPVTLLSSFVPNSVGTKTVTVSGLAENTAYSAQLTFETASGKTITKSLNFTTDSTSTDTRLESLKIVGADGTYNAIASTGDTYTAVISAGSASSVRIQPHARAGDKAVILVDGREVRSGANSVSIPITVGLETTVGIEVTAESGAVRVYTLIITVNP